MAAFTQAISHKIRSLNISCKVSGYEVRICTNKTCVRQGSRQVLQFARDVHISLVKVSECGCLGSCGNGPNIAIIPLNNSIPTILHHVSTPAAMAEAFTVACQGSPPIDATVLKATELRLAGNSAAMNGDRKYAIDLYSEALALNPKHGRYLLLANRSAAHLASGDADKALEDAINAVECAPFDFTTAGVRQADALFALQRYEEALMALERTAERSPVWSRSVEYKELKTAVTKAIHNSTATNNIFKLI